ncbi:MAG: anaerobic ribonucleoside-triphosphate reductase activating protein [Phycisphaerales bacterium]|nr:MAG: anaerobic ribonucleoside-triphosphate reductase activating protein [Phycisphaerales bacterium]
MNIGGFQPVTLTDYPGHIAAIVFAQGCNFRCPFCHNAALLATGTPPEGSMDERDILEALRARRSLLDAVVISGGEPTLQDNVVDFADRIKQRKLKVKLDTNGSRPAVLRELLNRRLLDCVAMDIKAPFHKYARLTGTDACTQDIRDSVALLVESDVPCEFRTTFVPALLAEDDVEEIRSYLPPQATYTVQPFVPDHALDESLRSAKRRVRSPQTSPPMRPGPASNDSSHHIDLLSGE